MTLMQQILGGIDDVLSFVVALVFTFIGGVFSIKYAVTRQYSWVFYTFGLANLFFSPQYWLGAITIFGPLPLFIGWACNLFYCVGSVFMLTAVCFLVLPCYKTYTENGCSFCYFSHTENTPPILCVMNTVRLIMISLITIVMLITLVTIYTYADHLTRLELTSIYGVSSVTSLPFWVTSVYSTISAPCVFVAGYIGIKAFETTPYLYQMSVALCIFGIRDLVHVIHAWPVISLQGAYTLSLTEVYLTIGAIALYFHAILPQAVSCLHQVKHKFK